MNEPGAGNSKAHNIGAYLKGVNALGAVTVGAGVGGSAVVKNGQAIDRFAYKLPLSMKGILSVAFTGTSGQSVEVLPGVQDSPDGTTFTDYGTQPDPTTVNAANDGSVVYAGIEVNVDLGNAQQYVRLTAKATLTLSGTDTAKIAAAAVLGGMEEIPQ